MDEEVKINVEHDPTSNEDVFDYDFLNPEEKEVEPLSGVENSENIVVTQFDTAFANSSKAIQDYILGNKLEESVRLICKIEKLEGEKAQVIVENIAVSILVGLLPINEAKETLIESFRSSGIMLEAFTASSILKSIDTYILTEIRKKILESKLENKREIRHLTLKEKREETEKEELRKILLERTGTLTGKGEPLIQYKEREKTQQQIIREEENKKAEEKKTQELNRESLLAKINVQNVSDTDKIKERMAQIKRDEEERMQRVLAKERKEEDRIEQIRAKEKEEEEARLEFIAESKEREETETFKNEDLSQILVEDLKEKLLANEDQKADLNSLRQQREIEEMEIQKNKNNDYYKSTLSEEIGEDEDENFDPYRESF